MIKNGSLSSWELNEKTFLRHKIKENIKYERQYHHYRWHFDFIIIVGVFLNASTAEIVIEIVNIHIFGKMCILGFNLKKKLFLISAIEDEKYSEEAPWSYQK